MILCSTVGAILLKRILVLGFVISKIIFLPLKNLNGIGSLPLLNPAHSESNK